MSHGRVQGYGEPVGKVTAFVTRTGPTGGMDLLLLHHAGIQLPAGTIEPGETPLVAAHREAQEETGLDDLVLVAQLGAADDTFPATLRVMAETAPVYGAPHARGGSWATLRRGFAVTLLRQVDDWLQVSYSYRETDPAAPEGGAELIVMFAVQGWVQAAAVAMRQTRHYFHFDAPGKTPDSWRVQDEGHEYQLVWYPLADLPPIVPPQDGWLRHFPLASG